MHSKKQYCFWVYDYYWLALTFAFLLLPCLLELRADVLVPVLPESNGVDDDDGEEEENEAEDDDDEDIGPGESAVVSGVLLARLRFFADDDAATPMAC